MKSFISEDDIEQALLNKLKVTPFNYDIIICDASLEAKDNPDNGPHRDSVEQCIIPSILPTTLSPSYARKNISSQVSAYG